METILMPSVGSQLEVTSRISIEPDLITSVVLASWRSLVWREQIRVSFPFLDFYISSYESSNLFQSNIDWFREYLSHLDTYGIIWRFEKTQNQLQDTLIIT